MLTRTDPEETFGNVIDKDRFDPLSFNMGQYRFDEIIHFTFIQVKQIESIMHRMKNRVEALVEIMKATKQIDDREILPRKPEQFVRKTLQTTTHLREMTMI